MVFTTTNLFKGIACPEGDNCKLTNCIYTHPAAPVTTAPKAATSFNEAHAAESHMRVSQTSLPAGQRRSKQIWKQLNPAKVCLMECRRQYLPRQHHLRQAAVTFLQVSLNPSHHLQPVD
jgi:hypothetical protein